MYYSLYVDNTKLIDLLHYSLFISLSVGILVQNKYILMLALSCLVIIQILWIKYKDCILNRISKIKHGYSEEICSMTLLLTIIYAFKIGLVFKD